MIRRSQSVKSLLMLLAALTFLIALPLTGQAQGGGDLYEPDDVTPGLINPFDTQDRTFDPDGDVDRVSFTLVAGYEYRLYTSALAAGVDTYLVVETSTGETYANDDAGPGTLASEIAFTPGAGGVATATLSNRIGQYGPERSYRLTLQAEAVPTPTPTPTGTPIPGDAYEVDDVTPRPIGLGETQEHSFDPTGDVDKVEFEVKPGRWYEVKTGNLAFNVDTRITAETQTSGRVYENDDAQQGTLSSRVLFYSQITEVVVVTIEHGRGLYGEGMTYNVYAGEYYPGPGDAYEPDDDPAQAAPIGIGESQSHSFHVDTDVDRACFPVKSGRRYTVQTANLAYGVDTVMEVEVGSDLYQNDDIGAGNLASLVEFEAAGDGTASIMVYNETGWGGDDKTYVLRVTEATATPTPPPADPYEPDGPDTPVTYLVGDKPQQRVFQAEGDTDHIRFTVKAGTCYEITTSELAPGVDTVIQVHRWNGSEWKLVGSNDDWDNKMTYASYFALTSPEDTDVRVDITNRGNAWGREATYAIGVRVTQPTPTPRPTATPTPALPPTPRPESSSPPTPTATPVSTQTPTGSSSSSGSGSKQTGGKGLLAILVFVDENKNNVYDVGVEGVQGMRVLLVNTRTPNKAAEQQTDATGYARFAAEEGAYNLLIPQLGYAQSQDLVGGENVIIPIPLPPLVLPPQLP
jgi:hypothetical protein